MVGKGVVFSLYLKQLLLRKPCAILYLLNDRVANPTPLNKFFKKIIKIKKIFLGSGEGIGVILFIPRTVSKVCAILYLLKEGVVNPHPFNKISSTSEKFAKNEYLQGNVFNCVKPIFFKPSFIERYIPLIHNAKKIRCPNSLGSEKMGVEVMYVKTFRLL